MQCPSAVVLLLIISNGQLAAHQAPDSLQLLSAFADSVRQVSDIPGLGAALELAKDDRAGDIAWRETRKGWMAFRMGQLEEGRNRLDEAIRYFDEAVFRDKRLALGWVGLAETKLLLEQRGSSVKASMHQNSGEYYETAALGHLVTALHLRPNYPAAFALLSRLLIEFDSPDFPPQLVEGIQLAAAQPDNGPVPQLLLGRYLRKQKDYHAARVAFQRYAVLGGDSGLANIELSRILFITGFERQAVSTYLSGAAVGDSLGRRALRRDLAWFASAGELETLDSLPRDSLGIWVRQLWARRDAENLRLEGERLKEHLRRWWFVQDHFRLVGRRNKARFGWGTSGSRHSITDENKELGVWALFEPGTLPESDPRALGVDDRGAVYLRHGEPDAKAFSVAPPGPGCLTANESWKYELPTGPIILHFCASEALGAIGPTTLTSMLPLDPAMIGARAGLDVRFGLMELDLLHYQQVIEWNRRGIRNAQPRINQEAARRLQTFGQASIRLGLTTDTHPLDYEKDLEPTVQIFGLSRSPGSGRALVVFAIRGDRIFPETREGRLFYPIKMRVTAVDTARGVTRTVDTLRFFLSADTLRKESYLYGTLDVPLPAGNYFVRALLEQPGRNAAGAAGRADVVVPGEPGALTLSDIVTGSKRSGLVWEQNGRRVALNPLDVYREGSSVELYYEVDEAKPGSSYQTTMEFLRIEGRGGRGKDQVTLTFSEPATERGFAVQRTVELNELGVGRYLLILTLTEDGSGRSVTRQRMINVAR